jgi:hypothetical protein
METNSKKNGSVGVTIFLLLLAGSLLFVSIKQQTNSEKNNKELSDQISKKVTEDVKKELPNIIEKSEQANSEFPDYSSLKDLKKLDIVDNFTSWTPNANLDDNKVIKKVILDKGDISKGYIYVRTSINGKAFTSWESIYLKMNNIGGHLYRPNTLPMPKSDKTELLYALDNISCLSTAPYSETRTPQKADWFTYFRNSKQIEIVSFISSLKPATIEEISLYYDCASGSDCLLKVE